MDVGDISWSVNSTARAQIKDLPPEVHNCYRDLKDAVQQSLCIYISLSQCAGRAAGVGFIETSADGGKVLKVRCALPGRGMSRSLRVLVVAYCQDKRIVVAHVDMRRDV